MIIHSNYDQRQFALVHLSFEEAVAFLCQGFCNQGASWSSSFVVGSKKLGTNVLELQCVMLANHDQNI